MSERNTTLLAVRTSMHLSQDELAQMLQRAALKHGDHIAVSKRTVQRWESGTSIRLRPAHARALQDVTGLPIESLGFPPGVDAMVVEDGRGGHDLEIRTPPLNPGTARQPAGNYTGIWLSRYEYYSSGRGQMFASQHYVVLMQSGDRLTVRSLPNSADSSIGMDLTVDGNVVTGTWIEETAKRGYYRGARYHGSIQLLAEPSGRRLSGKWVGFGSDGDVNTGPWRLELQDPSTSKATIAEYDRTPND
jgi:transcriptional regulator with XRE-family HTH domain